MNMSYNPILFSEDEWVRMRTWITNNFNEEEDYVIDKMTESCLILTSIFKESIIPAKIRKAQKSIYKINDN